MFSIISTKQRDAMRQQKHRVDVWNFFRKQMEIIIMSCARKKIQSLVEFDIKDTKNIITAIL